MLGAQLVHAFMYMSVSHGWNNMRQQQSDTLPMMWVVVCNVLLQCQSSPFFPGFLTPASSNQYSLMSTRKRPLKTLTFTKRLLEIFSEKIQVMFHTYILTNLDTYLNHVIIRVSTRCSCLCFLSSFRFCL